MDYFDIPVEDDADKIGGQRIVAGCYNSAFFPNEPPRLTSRGTGNEVEVLGEVAFYSQYDWLGWRFFLNLTMGF